MSLIRSNNPLYNLSVAAIALCLGANLAHTQDLSKTYTKRVNVGTFAGAVEANAASTSSKMSKNGRFVVFESTATNLVSPSLVTVTAGRRHIYLYDRQADSLELISLDRNGLEADSDCFGPSVSNDGRYVTFTSSTNPDEFFNTCFLDGCHLNKKYAGQHIYVRDRLQNITLMASQGPIDVKIQKRLLGVRQIEQTSECILAGCDAADNAATKKKPVMEKVAFRISAYRTDEVPPTSSDSVISGDGQHVTFKSDSDSLYGVVDAQLPDPVGGVTKNVAGGIDYSWSDGLLDEDYVMLPTGYYRDGNGVADLVVRNGKAFSNQLINPFCKFHEPSSNACHVGTHKDINNPQISDDGTIVAFNTMHNFLDLDFNQVDDVLWVKLDNISGEIAEMRRVSNNQSRLLSGNGASSNPSLSGDGRFVAFQSAATNLVDDDVNGKTDVFVYDTKFFTMTRCLGSNGNVGNSDSYNPSLTGSGEYISLESNSTNWGVASGLTNVYAGKLERDSVGRLTSCKVELASIGTGSGVSAGSATNASVGLVPVSVSVDGITLRTLTKSVAYQSTATNLHAAADDTNSLADIFQAPTCVAKDLATDTDGDGTTDCFDQCWKDQVKVTDTDFDGDGTADCEDGCKDDPAKRGEGECGCGKPDTDLDSDKVIDCKDECPSDPKKSAPGECGCGKPDTDSDGNNTADCKENVEPTPTPVAIAFTKIVPKKPVAERATAKSISLALATDLGTETLRQYRIKVIRKKGSKVTNRWTTASASPAVISNLKSGTYRFKYQILSLSGKTTLLSTVSNPIIIR